MTKQTNTETQSQSKVETNADGNANTNDLLTNQPDATTPLATEAESSIHHDETDPIQSGAPDGSILHLNDDDNDFLIDLVNEVIDRLDDLHAKVDQMAGPGQGGQSEPVAEGSTIHLTAHELQLLARCEHKRADCTGSWKVRILPTRTGKFLSICCTENCVFPQVIADDR